MQTSVYKYGTEEARIIKAHFQSYKESEIAVLYKLIKSLEAELLQFNTREWDKIPGFREHVWGVLSHYDKTYTFRFACLQARHNRLSRESFFCVEDSKKAHLDNLTQESLNEVYHYTMESYLAWLNSRVYEHTMPDSKASKISDGINRVQIVVPLGPAEVAAQKPTQRYKKIPYQTTDGARFTKPVEKQREDLEHLYHQIIRFEDYINNINPMVWWKIPSRLKGVPIAMRKFNFMYDVTHWYKQVAFDKNATTAEKEEYILGGSEDEQEEEFDCIEDMYEHNMRTYLNFLVLETLEL